MEGSLIHLVAGGVAGTAGALFTSPLEIVKTRLQGSVNSWSGGHALLNAAPSCSAAPHLLHCNRRLTITSCIRYIYRSEGPAGLFKGLSMTVAGVLPSRAIYFGAYFNGQELFAPLYARGSHANVFAASSFAGFVAATLTNPIWYVKTRLQLDESPSSRPLTVWRCIADTWRREGGAAFFKGIQASYVGIAETSLQFVLYEHMKRRLQRWAQADSGRAQSAEAAGVDSVVCCSVASACSKAVSTVACYPHEVLRTRLRQEGSKYRGLSQSLRLILREEGGGALYKGMLTHFVRQIPNTCIVLTVYEGILHLSRRGSLLL